MKRTLTALFVVLCGTAMAFSVSANSVATAEPIQLGKDYPYSYFQHTDDGNANDDYENGHFYSFTPETTDEYTVEVKGNWLNDNTWIEMKDASGRAVDYGYYNPYLNRTVATAKLSSHQKYYIEVWPGGESDVPQVLTASVSKHIHEYETKDYEKCTVKGYSEGYIDAEDGEYTNWCRVCEHEEYVTLTSPERVKLSASKLTYNGKVQKPKVKVITADGRTMSSYQVKYPASKAPGRYKMTIIFTGDYTGSIKVPYTIIPAKPGTPKLKAVKGGFNASWVKAGGAEGYQIEWGLDKAFFWADGQKITKKPSFSLKKKYASKSTVYVRIRAYKTFSGKKLYGSWSKAKSVKVK